MDVCDWDLVLPPLKFAGGGKERERERVGCNFCS